MAMKEGTDGRVVLSIEEMNDMEFLAHLRKLGENWRYSNEFIGLVVRRRYPRDYGDLKEGR